MNDLLKRGQRALTLSVATATIAWSVGIGAFLPLATSAASLTPGSLVKSPDIASVYYYSQDGKRYVFPNEKTYKTWYADFGSVMTITADQLASLPIGGNVTYRPGVKMVKITTDPKVYAVDANGTLRWITSEAAAVALYGSNWNKMVEDVADAFFTNYKMGGSIATAADFSPSAAMAAASSIDVNMGTSSTVTPVAGALNLSLASNTPAAASIPKGATAVKFLVFNVSGTGKITSLTAKRIGLGSASDFTNVYLYDGANRLTDGKSVNTTSNEVVFTGLNIDVAGSKTLWIGADMSSSISSPVVDGFQIESATKVSSTSSVGGSFPISGNLMTVITSSSVGTVTISKQGTVTNPRVGQDGAEIAKFKIVASGGEDAWLQSVALILKGTVNDTDVTNLKLKIGSTELASTAGVNSKELVVFTLPTPYKIADGETKNFSVFADLAGETNETVQLFLDENTDLVAVGGDFGYGMTVVSTAYDNSANDGTDASWSTLEGGDVTFAFNGPSATDVAVNGENVPFLKLALSAERNITVKSLDLIVAATNSDDGLVDAAPTPDQPNLEEIAIRNAATGAIVSGPEEIDVAGSDTTQTLTFGDDFTVMGGQTLDLLFTADVRDNATVAGEKFKFTLDVSGLTIEDDHGDAISNIVPSADIVGYEMTVVASGLTLSLATTPVTDTFVKGTKNVEAAGFLFEATKTSDVKITDITLTSFIDEDGTASNGDFMLGTDTDPTPDVAARDVISSVSLYDGTSGAKVAGPESITTDGEAVFDNIAWTVPAGAVKKLVVKVDISTNAPNNANNDLVAFDIVAVNDVTAEDKEGDDVTIGAGDINPNSNQAGGADTQIDNASNQPNVYIGIASAGTLTVSVDSTRPDAEVVVAGTSNVPTYALKFVSTVEAFNVKDFNLENINNADNDNINSITVSYPTQSGATETKTAFFTAGGSNGVAQFRDMNLYVPADDDAVVTVWVNLNTIEAGADSADTVQTDFVTTSFKAVGSDSGNTLGSGDITDSTTAGNVQTVFKTKPTVTLAAGSPSGAGIPGYAEVVRYNVAADVKEDVTIRGFCFDLTSTDNAASSWNYGNTITDTDFDLYLSTDMGSSIETTADAADVTWYTSNTCVGGSEAGAAAIESVLFNLETNGGTNDEVIVAKGTTKTFVLKFDSTGASASQDDSVRFDVRNIYWHDNSYATASNVGGEFPTNTAADFTTTTISGVSINSANLDNLTVNGGTIVY